jgi:hypothetical protein
MCKLYSRIATVLVGLALVLGMVFPVNATPVTNANPSQIEIDGQVSFGLGYGTNTNLFNYQEPGTTTCLFNGSTTVFIPPSTTNQAVNLTTLFPYINTPVLWGWCDISNPGQAVTWSLTSSGATIDMAPGGFSLFRVNGGAPTIYFNNADMANTAIIRVFFLAN